MSTLDINKVENEDENKTPDKKQIEAEEKEVMLKCEVGAEEAPAELTAEGEGPVKAALSGDVTEQGREVKPKFIPIGAIKMPGFFTRNSTEKEKAKEDEADKEKNGEGEEEKPKRHRLQFLHTCPFTQFMHHPRHETEDGETQMRRRINLNLKYPKIFQKRSTKDPEAALASMETLEDKLDTPNGDGMENVKLDTGEPEEGKVATKLPLKERIRQKKFIMDDVIVGCVALLVLLAVIVGVCVGARAGPPAERPLRLGKYITTLTSCGPVEGIRDEDVYKFYGIPYAVQPVGALRFTYAAPLDDISLCWNGTLPAHAPAPPCAQLVDGAVAGREDCLALDVVTPHVRYDSPLPVVVLLGAATLWGGASPAQPSAMYARTKEVVFVRPDFRLGPFGFLALDVLSAARYPPASGNYALSDLVVALQWVQLNARHFGGDPRAVTLLAHRAGATLAAALGTVRRAAGLYSRAWLSEPSAVLPAEPLEEAQKRFDRFKQVIRCADAECLRRKSVTEILSTVPDVWMTDYSHSLPEPGEAPHSWLVVDGELLRRPVLEAWLEQRQGGKDRPVVLGTTQHAGHSEALRGRQLNWTAAAVERLVNASALGGAGVGAAALRAVGAGYAGLAELVGGVRLGCPLARLRARLGAALYVARGEGGALAGPGADVRAILGTFDSSGTAQRRFMAAMQQLFYYWVWHGQLAGPASPLLAVGQDLLPLPSPPLCAALEPLGDQYALRD